MFYNIKIAFRNLRRNGLYSWINVIGLAVSLTACILLSLWIKDELGFDKFHKNADRIYTLHFNAGNDNFWPWSPAPLAGKAKAENPEIVESCRTTYYNVGYFEYENEKIRNYLGLTVDSTFFEFFDFPLLQGNRERPFPTETSMLITEEMAKAVFGEEDPIGKTLKGSNDVLFTVAGILKKTPNNSSIQFDYLVTFDVQQRTFGGNGDWKFINEDWGSYAYQTYFLLNDPANVKTVEENISQKMAELRGVSYDFLLQPFVKTHLYRVDGEPTGMKTVRLFLIIDILILLVACINYVNLVTARATKRAKEISVRKIMGANRGALFTQLMSETILLLIISFIIATIFIYLLLPQYNQLSWKTLDFGYRNGSVWLIYGVMAVSVLALAGIYPAFFTTSFKPLDAFHKNFGEKRGGSFLRKILVVVQFVFSFGLIVVTIGISLQMKYMREKDLGYDKEQVFTIWSGAMFEHYDAIKNELLQNKDILAVSAADHNRMMAQASRGSVSWPGKPDDFQPVFDYTVTQYDFYEMMKVPIVEGSYPAPTDTFGIMINETAAKVMELEDPIGKPFYVNDSDFGIIKGILKDYHFHALNEPIRPLLMMTFPDIASYIYIKTTATGAKNAIEAVRQLWAQYNPDYDFWYIFLDTDFERIYYADLRTGKLITLFAIIAVLISCLGLFGLVTYTAESKTKEIGIRKVLGAGVGDIVGMLSREFLILVGIAILIAFPLSYFWLRQMLQDYAYHINISWWIFGIAALATIVLTLLTVSFQALKAATANPVKAIASN